MTLFYYLSSLQYLLVTLFFDQNFLAITFVERNSEQITFYEDLIENLALRIG